MRCATIIQQYVQMPSILVFNFVFAKRTKRITFLGTRNSTTVHAICQGLVQAPKATTNNPGFPFGRFRPFLFCRFGSFRVSVWWWLCFCFGRFFLDRGLVDSHCWCRSCLCRFGRGIFWRSGGFGRMRGLIGRHGRRSGFLGDTYCGGWFRRWNAAGPCGGLRDKDSGRHDRLPALVATHIIYKRLDSTCI